MSSIWPDSRQRVVRAGREGFSSGLPIRLCRFVDPSLIGDEIGSVWITLHPMVSQSVSQSVSHTFVRTVVKIIPPTSMVYYLKNNYLPLDIILKIGITRATAYTGYSCLSSPSTQASLYCHVPLTIGSDRWSQPLTSGGHSWVWTKYSRTSSQAR